MSTIYVYMQDGRTFFYEVADATKAREHAHRIINFGWRNLEGDTMCYYPVHQILKVVFPVAADDTDYLQNKYRAKPCDGVVRLGEEKP